jgi:hypothetical protein
MRVPAKIVVLYSALLVGTACASPALAQSQDPAWLDDLRMQLQVDEQCEVNYFVNMREGQLGAHNFYEARVQCSDGRMFDANKTEPEKQFTIKACGTAAC